MNRSLEDQFQKMGARAYVTLRGKARETRAWNGKVIRQSPIAPVRLDVLRDGKGDYFALTHRWDVQIQALDVRKRDRHLLLMARAAKDFMSTFLCGHDERHWFVAAVPESAAATNVQQAMDALKPQAVWDSIREHGVPPHQRNRRWTRAFVRQGEWFFLPRPNLDIGAAPVFRNEPIRRGGGKPHMCQFLCRFGGEEVFVNSDYPNGLRPVEFTELDPEEQKQQGWRRMTRDARPYVKGAIRHPDHETIWLADWHEVVMNTETQSSAMSHLAFLD